MFIDSYKSVTKELNAPIDPAGFPHHFNNTWMPWLPDDYRSIGEMHFMTSGVIRPGNIMTSPRPRLRSNICVSAEELG